MRNIFKKRGEAEKIALHIAGATILHKNPFEEIFVPRNSEPLSAEFINKWVAPFYFTDLQHIDESKIKEFAAAANEISIEIVKLLLGNFDWRTRITAAYFSAINQYTELEDILGNHLLKSEVCYAGTGYSIALAAFQTAKAKDYLVRYLNYYLKKKNLWFDQADVLCSLAYFDKSLAEQMLPKWIAFVANKPNWDLKSSETRFNKYMLTIDKIRTTSSLK